MTASQLTPQQLQDIRDLAAQWGKIVARRAFGDAGPGLNIDLLALEAVADAAARGLTEGTLSTLLAQQAQALPTEHPCPDCGQLCPVGSEPRPLACKRLCFSTASGRRRPKKPRSPEEPCPKSLQGKG